MAHVATIIDGPGRRTWRVLSDSHGFHVACSHDGDPYEASTIKPTLTDALAYITDIVEGATLEVERRAKMRGNVRAFVSVLDCWVHDVDDDALSEIDDAELYRRLMDLARTLDIDSRLAVI